jgi:UDP-glucose 4-epimerase
VTPRRSASSWRASSRTWCSSLEEPSGGTTDKLVPLSPYAAAKLAAGAYARMFAALYRTPVVNLRLFMTYGPGQHPTKVIPHAILALLRGEAPRLSTGTRRLDWVYVDDAIDALVAAAVRPGLDGHTLDVGSGTAGTIRDVVARIVRLVDPSIQPLYSAQPDRPDRSDRVADVAPAAAALDWRATTTLDDGLARTVEWYRSRLRP